MKRIWNKEGELVARVPNDTQEQLLEWCDAYFAIGGYIAREGTIIRIKQFWKSYEIIVHPGYQIEE